MFYTLQINSRAKAWASTQADSFSALSFSSGGIQLAPEEGNQWREGLEDLLPEMDLDMPSVSFRHSLDAQMHN